MMMRGEQLQQRDFKTKKSTKKLVFFVIGNKLPKNEKNVNRLFYEKRYIKNKEAKETSLLIVTREAMYKVYLRKYEKVLSKQ